MATKFSYDSDSDSLIISNKIEGEKVKRNFMFDDFIISLSRKGKILSMEIREASQVLKQMGINPKILDKIKGAELIVIPKKDSIFIGFLIRYELKKEIKEQKVPVTHIPMAITN